MNINILGLRMEVTFDVVEGVGLVLTYEVTNDSDHDVYLMNRLMSYSEEARSRVLSPDIILVTLHPETGVIAFSKTLADVMPGAYKPIAPYDTPLRARGIFREEVKVSLPVREFNQYRTARSGVAREYPKASFTLGYYVCPLGTRERTERRLGQEVILTETPPGVQLRFGEVTSDTEALPRPVPAIALDEE